MSEKKIKCFLGELELSDDHGPITMRANGDRGENCYVLLSVDDARKVAATLQAFAEINSP